MHVYTLYVDSQPVTYYDNNGIGSAIVFIHGNSSSGRTFHPQFESTLGAHHRLVALDLPGFGSSQPVVDSDAAMGLQGWASIVQQVIASLQLARPVLVGWSLGGHIALEAVSGLPDAKGVLIYGTPPLAWPPDMAQAFLPHPAMAYSFQDTMSSDEMDAYVTAFFAPGVEKLSETFREDIRRSDSRARAAVGGSIRPGGYADEVEVVAHMTVPLAVLHGDQEQLINGDYISTLSMPTLWRGQVQTITGAGHAPHWEQPQQFNSLLEAFVQDCNQG